MEPWHLQAEARHEGTRDLRAWPRSRPRSPLRSRPGGSAPSRRLPRRHRPLRACRSPTPSNVSPAPLAVGGHDRSLHAPELGRRPRRRHAIEEATCTAEAPRASSPRARGGTRWRYESGIPRTRRSSRAPVVTSSKASSVRPDPSTRRRARPRRRSEHGRAARRGTPAPRTRSDRAELLDLSRAARSACRHARGVVTAMIGGSPVAPVNVSELRRGAASTLFRRPARRGFAERSRGEEGGASETHSRRGAISSDRRAMDRARRHPARRACEWRRCMNARGAANNRSPLRPPPPLAQARRERMPDRWTSRAPISPPAS